MLMIDKFFFTDIKHVCYYSALIYLKLVWYTIFLVHKKISVKTEDKKWLSMAFEKHSRILILSKKEIIG